MIGEFFHCERVEEIHTFVLGTQRKGGDLSGSISLLSKNRMLWAERIVNLQKEFQIIKRNIIIALAATLLICLLI